MMSTWMNLLVVCMTVLTSNNVSPLWEEDAPKALLDDTTKSAPLLGDADTHKRMPLIWTSMQAEEDTLEEAPRMAQKRHSGASPAYEAEGRIAGQKTPQTHWVIDRFEAEEAVIEGIHGTFRIPKHALPKDMLLEGTVLELRVLPQEMERRQALALARIQRMKHVEL